MSPEPDELLTWIDDLDAVPVGEAFPSLVALRSELDQLERQFAARAVDDVTRDALWDEPFAALDPMIGQEADSSMTDPLLRSHAAHNSARLFLARRAGLIGAVAYK